MRKFNLIALVFTAFILTVSFSTASAQEETSTDNEPKQSFNKPNRPNLLAELDLSIDQIQQIRRINRDKKPFLRDAQQKVRQANRSLDQAIYADETNETEITARLKDLQTAQAEVSAIRSMTEYAVRKILTPAQLVKFREVRQRFMQDVENRIINRPKNRFNNQNQRFNNRQRQFRQNN